MTSTLESSMLDESKRQRAMRPEIHTIHAALAFVRPLYQKIYGWHVETARLRGLSAVVVGDERRRSSYLEEAQALLQAVRAARRSFERETADLPKIVADNSRIADVGRALDSIAAGLGEAICRLQTSPAPLAQGRGPSHLGDGQPVEARPPRAVAGTVRQQQPSF
jgi:hypothetical protein